LVVSRNVDPLTSAVVTVGSIHGGEAPNVICDTVKLSGTVRTYSKETQDLVEERLHALCLGVGAAHGAEITLTYLKEAPAVINSSTKSVENVNNSAKKIAPNGVHDRCRSMASEDFAFFLHERSNYYSSAS